jgi:hypothetical protein
MNRALETSEMKANPIVKASTDKPNEFVVILYYLRSDTQLSSREEIEVSVGE